MKYLRVEDFSLSLYHDISPLYSHYIPMIILPLYPRYIPPYFSRYSMIAGNCTSSAVFSSFFWDRQTPVQSQSAAFAPERVRCVRGQWRCDPQWKLKAQRMVCVNREIYVYRCLLPMETTVLSMENYECFFFNTGYYLFTTGYFMFFFHIVYRVDQFFHAI